MLHADAPGLAAAAANRDDIAADVDQRAFHPLGTQVFRRQIERIALGIAAKVELDGRILAVKLYPLEHDIGHARIGLDQRLDFRGVRQLRLELVTLEPPEFNQLADGGIEQAARHFRKARGILDDRDKPGTTAAFDGLCANTAFIRDSEPGSQACRVRCR